MDTKLRVPHLKTGDFVCSESQFLLRWERRLSKHFGTKVWLRHKTRKDMVKNYTVCFYFSIGNNMYHIAKTGENKTASFYFIAQLQAL